MSPGTIMLLFCFTPALALISVGWLTVLSAWPLAFIIGLA